MTTLIDTLNHWTSEVAILANVLPTSSDLRFQTPITSKAPPYRLEETPGQNITSYALEFRSRENAAFLRTQLRFTDILKEVERINTDDIAVTTLAEELAATLKRELVLMDIAKARLWERRRQALLYPGKKVVDTSPYWDLFLPKHPAVAAAIGTALTMQNLFHLPRRGMAMLLAGMRDMLQSLTDSEQAKQASEALPADPRTIYSMYAALDASLSRYVCCPRCQNLSSIKITPDDSPSGDINCSKVLLNGERCTEPLWIKEDISNPNRPHVWSPRQQYAGQSLADWLGRLLCRDGVEKVLDTYPYQVDPAQVHGPSAVGDIIFSKIFKLLSTKHGKTFLQPPDKLGERCGRYVFCLCVDSFNPFHMKTAKQVVSATGVWMMCLNFPPHLRILPENMFLQGTISGKEIEPYLELLVTEINEFYDPGVWYTKTRKWPEGRLVQLLLIPLICDMLALRQAAGFGGVTSTFFCTCCTLPYAWMENLDHTTWQKRDIEAHRVAARDWKRAVSEEERRRLSEAGYGVRWSPMLRIPYMNIILYSIPDSLHLMCEIIQITLRGFWKIDSTRPGGDGTVVKLPFDHNSEDIKQRKIELERKEPRDPGLLAWLEKQRLPLLQGLCFQLKLRYATHRSRRQLALRLVHWHLKRRNVSVMKYEVDDGEIEVNSSKEYPIIKFASQSLATAANENDEGLPLLPDSDDGVIAVEDVDDDDDSVDILNSASKDPVLAHFLTLPILDSFRKRLDGQRPAGPLGYNDTLFETLYTKFLEDEVVALPKFVRKLTRLGAGLLEEREKWDEFKKDVYIIVAQGCSVQFHEKDTKVWLHRQLQYWIQYQLQRAPLPDEAIQSPTSGHPRHVLGSDVLKEIWRDMERTQLPSYLDPAPNNWGTPSRGKLKLNNWHMLGSIHLPITLIRLWGSLPEDARLRKILDNFMQLNRLLRIGNLRYTTTALIEEFSSVAEEFIHRLLALFPDTTMKPMQHVLLHAFKFMDLFGPHSGYNVAAFERYVRFEQDQSTNTHIGELEMTMTRASIRSTNFRAFLSGNPVAQTSNPNLVERFEAIFKSRSKNITSPFTDAKQVCLIGTITIIQDLVDPAQISAYLRKTPSVSALRLRSLPVRIKISSSSGCMFCGLPYATYQQRRADSCILYKSDTGSPSYKAGEIMSIFLVSLEFQHSTESLSTILFDVKPYELVCHSNSPQMYKDLDLAYRRYGVGGGMLCTSRLLETIPVAAESAIHAIKTPLYIPLDVDHEITHVLADRGA